MPPLFPILIALRGIVVDTSGSPVPFAYVSCGGSGTYTDMDGTFAMDDASCDSIRVEHIAYRDTLLRVHGDYVRIVLRSSVVEMGPSIVRARYERVIQSVEEEDVSDGIFDEPLINPEPAPYGAGISLSAMPPEYTLILVDGRPVYGRILGGVDVFSLPFTDAKRVEIMSGSSSALYGSYAIGGVINIITGGSRGVYASSSGDFRIRWPLSSIFGSSIYAGRASYYPVVVYSLGTSINSPLYLRVDASWKENPSTGENISDVRGYVDLGGLYLNYFGHVYRIRNAVRSFTSEYHLSWSDERSGLLKNGVIKWRYGLHGEWMKSSLVDGFPFYGETFFAFEYTRSRYSLAGRLVLDSRLRFPVLLPQVSIETGVLVFNLGAGYRPPHLKEMYIHLDYPELGFRVEGNPDLRPEKSVSASVSFSTSSLFLSLRYSRIWDYIDADVGYYDGNVPVFVYMNVDSYDAISHEGRVEHSAGGWNFRASWQLARSGFDVPPYRFRAGISYGGWSLEFLASGPTRFSPSYSRWSLSKEMEMGSVKVRIGVKDVFNQTANLSVPYLKGREVYAQVDF